MEVTAAGKAGSSAKVVAKTRSLRLHLQLWLTLRMRSSRAAELHHGVANVRAQFAASWLDSPPAWLPKDLASLAAQGWWVAHRTHRRCSGRARLQQQFSSKSAPGRSRAARPSATRDDCASSVEDCGSSTWPRTSLASSQYEPTPLADRFQWSTPSKGPSRGARGLTPSAWSRSSRATKRAAPTGRGSRPTEAKMTSSGQSWS